MNKKNLHIAVWGGCVVFCCMIFFIAEIRSADSSIMPKNITILSSNYRVLSTDGSMRDGGYQSWIFFSKDGFNWESPFRKNEQTNEKIYFFDEKKIVADVINKSIPFWKFYEKVSLSEILSISSFDLSNSTGKCNAQVVKTSKGFYLLVLEHQ